MTALKPAPTGSSERPSQLEWILPAAVTGSTGEGWAVELVDPVAVEHQNATLVFARQPGDDDRLYYSVRVTAVDREAGPDGPSWYVLSLADEPRDTTLGPGRCVRGDGALVVLASRAKVTPRAGAPPPWGDAMVTPRADAPQPWAEVGCCRIISDGVHVYVFRRSSGGPRHLRFALVESTGEELGHEREPHLAPEP